MRHIVLAAAIAAALLWPLSRLEPSLTAQTRANLIAPANQNSLRAWDDRVAQMLNDGELRVRRERPDTLVNGRTIQYLDQMVDGVRVWNAGVNRQLAGNEAVSVFGTVYDVPAMDTVPEISAETAKATIERTLNVELGESKAPELVVVPEDNSFRLAWVGFGFSDAGRFRVFVDARSGDVVRTDNVTETQLPTGAYVGHGKGVYGDDKKVSSDSLSGSFVAADTIRPPVILTFDLRQNQTRSLAFLNGATGLGVADLASTTSNNEWTDGAVVDAHVYSSYTYDYYFKRFGRRGLDNGDIPMANLVHLVRRGDYSAARDTTLWLNAFYGGSGLMVYGEGCDCTTGGQRVTYFSAGLDVVAHELTHGVTEYTSNLDYLNESGALNEAISDIMGTAVEFYFQPLGSGPLKSDWLMGEDVFTAVNAGGLNGIRSMSDPAQFGYPDHYSRRYTGTQDNGGVHVNSSIVNQAYYLAVEGGTNRTSGIRVTGVGATSREQIEKIYYRAFAQLMPSNANFAMARTITLQAAQDLYGASSAAYAAVRDGWTAVGVN